VKLRKEKKRHDTCVFFLIKLKAKASVPNVI